MNSLLGVSTIKIRSAGAEEDRGGWVVGQGGPRRSKTCWPRRVEEAEKGPLAEEGLFIESGSAACAGSVGTCKQMLGTSPFFFYPIIFSLPYFCPGMCSWGNGTRGRGVVKVFVRAKWTKAYSKHMHGEHCGTEALQVLHLLLVQEYPQQTCMDFNSNLKLQVLVFNMGKEIGHIYYVEFRG